MAEEKVISAHDTGTTPGTATVATLYHVDDQPLINLDELRVRLNVTQALDGTTPTLDVYLQRAVGVDPGDDDWQDFYHFPQVTTSLVDVEVALPLPAPQDADGSLASASDAVVQESLAADTLLAGHWGSAIRIREVIGGTPSQAAVYDVEMVGR